MDAFIAELIQTWEVLTQTEKWRVEKGVPVTQEGKKLLTPMEIHHKKFRRRFRGYDVDDVNDFLDRVIQSAEQLIKEKA